MLRPRIYVTTCVTTKAQYFKNILKVFVANICNSSALPKKPSGSNLIFI